ncbi:response regulator [Patescibacteria group bacterium]|nr:response regulator [Patescibacteria group bacterium]
MNTTTEKKKVILLVEDERDLVELYSELLKDSDYNVEVAYDGSTALQKVLSESWDLLLLDIMLPEKDGLTILEEIKKAANAKRGPIILLTNLNNEDLIKRAFSLGADGYLIKSEISLDDVVNEVKTRLAKNEQQK